FNNRITGTIITHVYGPDPANPTFYQAGLGTDDFNFFTNGGGTMTWNGPFFSGSGYSAQIWSAPGANQLESSLAPMVPLTTFRTGAAAGFVAGTTITLANVPSFSMATVTMRVWDNQGGTLDSWAAALAANTPHGETPLFDLYIAGDLEPASV